MQDLDGSLGKLGPAERTQGIERRTKGAKGLGLCAILSLETSCCLSSKRTDGQPENKKLYVKKRQILCVILFELDRYRNSPDDFSRHI
jgi:hypothetical protein